MTVSDPAEPAQPGTEPRGVGEALDAPAPVDPAHPRRVTLRRAPRYRAFIGTGAVVGVVLALVLVTAFPDDGRFSTGAVLGYLGVSLALVGGLLGGALAVLVERPRRAPRS